MKLYIILIGFTILIHGFSGLFEELATVKPNIIKIMGSK